MLFKVSTDTKEEKHPSYSDKHIVAIVAKHFMFKKKSVKYPINHMLVVCCTVCMWTLLFQQMHCFCDVI